MSYQIINSPKTDDSEKPALDSLLLADFSQ